MTVSITNEDIFGLQESYRETKDIGTYERYHVLVPELFDKFPEMMQARTEMHKARIQFETRLMRLKLELDEEDLELF